MPLRTTMGTVDHQKCGSTEPCSTPVPRCDALGPCLCGSGSSSRLLTGEPLPRRDWRADRQPRPIDGQPTAPCREPGRWEALLRRRHSWITLPRGAFRSYTARDLEGVMSVLESSRGVSRRCYSRTSHRVTSLRSHSRSGLVESTVGFHHSIGRWVVVGPVMCATAGGANRTNSSSDVPGHPTGEALTTPAARYRPSPEPSG